MFPVTRPTQLLTADPKHFTDFSEYLSCDRIILDPFAAEFRHRQKASQLSDRR